MFSYNFTALERSAILWISWIYTTQPWYILLFLCRDEPECCVLAQYKPLSAVFIYTSYILISIVFLKQAIFTIHYILHKVVEEYVMQYDHRYLKNSSVFADFHKNFKAPRIFSEYAIHQNKDQTLYFQTKTKQTNKKNISFILVSLLFYDINTWM